MAFVVESPAFRNGDPIPRKYSRDGDNISPPLMWKNAPKGTRSFVLIAEDPDAPKGTFHHWAVYDISPLRGQLPEGAMSSAGHGVNDFGNPYYDGPQPPKGHGVHHYHFRLAALDTNDLNPGEGATVAEIWAAAQPHVLAQAELIGTFENA